MTGHTAMGFGYADLYYPALLRTFRDATPRRLSRSLLAGVTPALPGTLHMTHRRRSLFASVASIALFVACGGDTPVTPIDTTHVVPPPPPAIVVAGVRVAGPARLLVGRSDVVVATATTSAGVVVTGRTAAYVSSNPAAITVGATDGAVRSIAPGTAVISATVDGIVGTLTILASDASLYALTLSGPTSPITVGTTAQLSASGKDSSSAAVAIRSITYASSSPSVATVSQTGLVTAVAPGTTTIAAEGITVAAAQATIAITVIPVAVASVSIVPPADTILHQRFPKQLVAVVKDAQGNTLQRPVTFTTSDVDVASLDPFGRATATYRQGPVTVTAAAEGKSGSVRLYVVSDSGLYVATTGGVAGDPVQASIDQPNATSPGTSTGTVPADLVSRFNFVTSNGTYRVRTSTSADPARSTAALSGIALLLGATSAAVPVTLGPPSTVVSIPLKPYAATISAPTTVGVNATVTVTWTFDEATMPFAFYPDRVPVGALYFSTLNGADLSGTAVNATVTRDAATGISTFSASFTAPATPGTVYVQVSADGAVARLLSPIVFRGQALRTITVQ